MIHLLKLFNNLSLNVVLCTILCSFMFAKLPQGDGDIQWVTLTLLGLCTWLIYLLDRLLDIRIYPPETSSRHLFHFKYRTILSFLIAALVGIAGALSLFLPVEVFWYGVTLLIVIAIYLFVLNRFMKKDNLQWAKEPFTAIFYIAAVVGVVLISMPVIFLSTWLLTLMFFVVVSQNLLLFSFFEKLQQPAAVNSVSYFGVKKTEKLNRWAFIAVLFIFILFFTGEWNYRTLVALLLTLMSLTLSIMPILKEKLLINERYRWLGDGVLLLSAISFFF